MRLKAFILSALLLSGTTAMAQTSTHLPKGSKIYVTATNEKAASLAKEELAEKGYWILTDDKEEADVILDLRVKRIWLNDRKAYAVFTDAKTQKDIYETRPVTTLTRFTFRPGQGVVKKLIKKRVNKLYA